MVKKITIKDLAKATNVSIGTIDRALNNRPGISEKTKSKVLKVAKEMGYEVNKVAQSLSRKPIKIGCILPGNSDYFFPEVESGIIDAQKSLIDYNVEILCIKTKKLGSKSEIKYIQEVMKKGIDGLAIFPQHRTEMNNIINEIVNNNIPVVTIGTDAPESNRTTCVSIDSFTNGQIAGELLSNFIGNKGKVAIITGFYNLADHQEKVKGFANVICSYPNSIELVGVYGALENPEIIYNMVKEILNHHPDLKGIYFNSSNSIYGCDALIDLGKEENVAIITTDLSNEQIPYIEKGIIKATIHQHPHTQGYKAIKILYDILTSNKKYGPNDYVKPDIILRHNIKYFL
ncbi:LacI family DNA-binding transcriptional regulator [Clostridium brassicae]|uniref:LacI family DNA-binding transcriptional regulator n=1 Tax=Clostridium brassicae TaxID=2999072 RepID=A0ABT4DBK3_9CLOT|nr:LacI family DNA-binding transcriptional regulator [Clostridium brassicae]MCY6958611.1 LacI family DNA-binding transcriptional regulator [Clostridium brassicae]